VIAFPGVDIAAIHPRPRRIEDLPAGGKALVVTHEDARFVVRMRPALTAKERQVQRSFASHREAMVEARRAAAYFPKLYQLVLDETPQQLRSLAERLEIDPLGLEPRR
jgi:hypothetical protein